MKAAIVSIRKELDGIYSKGEIESLIFLIFEKLKGYSRTQFLLSKDEILPDDELAEIGEIVLRLKNHEPIQYILGQTEFYGLPFYVVPGVLIPRPETEELVQWIIQENKLAETTVFDMGTGTGCIAVSLRKNIPGSKVWACDISPACLDIVRRNAELNSVQINVIEYDILNDTPVTEFSRFDVIVSNPPYIREAEKALMEKNVLDFEPELALFVSDKDALIFYERIADFARIHLRNRGRLYFEINEAFGQECSAMLLKKGFTKVAVKKDINGKDRMIGCRFLT